MVRRNRSVRATRKKRHYGGARTKGVPHKYVPRPSRFPIQAMNAARVALQQVQNQAPVKQKRRVTEKKLAANQRRRNISKKFKNRGIKQNPGFLREYKERSAAGESNNAILGQWMNPGAAVAAAAAGAAAAAAE